MSHNSQPAQLSEQQQVRRKSREALESVGINPYPYGWPVRDSVAPVLEEFQDTSPEKVVSLAGRLMSRRIMGKASFFDLQDATGRIQVYVRRDDLPEGFYNESSNVTLILAISLGLKGMYFEHGWGNHRPCIKVGAPGQSTSSASHC